MASSRLTQRKQFLAVARGKRAARRNVVVQAKKNSPTHDALRTGFTATKKTGNAVRRNRSKRRLRAASAQLLGQYGRNGWDYVFIARRGTANAKWQHLLDDMRAALQSLHKQSKIKDANVTNPT